MSDIDAQAQEVQEEAAPVSPAIKEMMDAGVFFGRIKARTHPRMKQFVIANRNRVDILNLEKTEEQLKAAMEFLKEKASSGAHIMLVATQPPAHESALKIGEEFGIPVVTLRWLGGTLTNYKIISQRVEHFKKLKSDLASGAFEDYTKKEKLDLQKQADKMEEIFSGMTAMTTRPDLLVMIDPVFHKTAAAEARRLGIPMVALANSDADPDKLDYPVLGNTKARSSIIWFLEYMAAAIREGRKMKEMAKPDEKKTPETKTEE